MTTFILTVTWVDEQVECIVVEFEFLAVCLRHRTPYFESTIVLVSLIVVTTIKAILRTVVCRNNIRLDCSSQRRISGFVCILLCLRHTVAYIDVLCSAELDGARTDISWSHVAIHGSSLCIRYCTTNIQVFNITGIFLGDDICLFEICLSIWNGRRMMRLHRLVGVVDILSDKVAHHILTLSEDTTRTAVLQMIGRSVFVSCTARLVLFCSSALKHGVPCIPICWIVHPVSQHITRIVAHVVRRTIYEVEVHHFLLLYVVNLWVNSLQSFIFRRQHHRTCRDDVCIATVIFAVSYGDVGFIHKQSLL